MTYLPSNTYRKTRGIIRRESRANQPLATTVLEGTLYYVTDEKVTERSNGTVWESYSDISFSSNQVIPGLDGEDGEDSFIPGPIGSQGSQGIQGLNGLPGIDGEEGREEIIIISSVQKNDSVVVAFVFEKAETGTDANILTYTTGAIDEFLVVQIAIDISALTGTSVVVTVAWNDSNNAAQTSTITLTGVADGSINIPINVKTATNVVVSTVFVGVSTAYNISAFITKLR